MLHPRHPAPELEVPVAGGAHFALGAHPPETFTILVFYRGKHCPICSTYLKSVEEGLDDAYAIGADVVAVSMDKADRAEASMSEWGLKRLRLGYDLPETVARAYGLYISSARPGSSEPERFSEPGLVVVDRTGIVYFAQSQSAPFTRPPFAELVSGLKFVLDNDYPARGDLTAQAA
ncbi:MAG: peroxiredoxin-like family protein [Paracoccaceae bacterium]